MARNRLLPPPVPEPRDPRCTGRTTAIALDVISRALASQGKVCYAEDHANQRCIIQGAYFRDRVLQLVQQLNLSHMNVGLCTSGGPYHGQVRVSSNIWEE